MLLVIICYVEFAKLVHNRVDVASASSGTTAASLAASEPADQPADVPGQSLHPSTLPSPQPVWRHLVFDTLPIPRISSSFILNPLNKIALLFGGYNASHGVLNDIWLTNGLSWMQFQTPHSPEPRYSASMAYDEVHQMAVLFGGMRYDGTLLNDTWLFDGVDWVQQQSLISPSPRSSASMAYDADQEINILFGGQADTGEKYWQALNEMWVWDGENWQQQFPATLPPPRWGANMVYDRAHKSIVLFGGVNDGSFWEDTWLWDGTSWIEQHPLHHPAGRANFGMSYDEDRQQVILFGGQTYLDVDPTETWAWDGQDWTLLPTRQAPSKELAYGAQLAYFPDLQSVLLYNAFREKTLNPDDTFTITEHSEVWALTYWNLLYFPMVNGQ